MEQGFGVCTVQNTGVPLALNHMIREESYFLNQLAQVTTQLSVQ
ncbi:hypothetical protein [Desulfotruncus arcticus]|nr:hypothetical protein [Desulfotruncus arcticus]